MPHLWVEESPGDWAVLLLDDLSLSVNARRTAHEDEPRRSHDRSPDFVVVRGGPATSAVRFLVAPPDSVARVNGAPLAAAIRQLADRDEIRVGDACWYFSSEELVRVEPFPASTALPCARCHQPIEHATSAVHCPSCRLWHHESEASRCFSYAETCAGCDQPTAIDTSYRWSPTEL